MWTQFSDLVEGAQGDGNEDEISRAWGTLFRLKIWDDVVTFWLYKGVLLLWFCEDKKVETKASVTYCVLEPRILRT